MPDIMKVEYNTRVLLEAASLMKNNYEVNVLGFSNLDKSFEKKIDGIKCYSFYLCDVRSGLKKIYRYFTALKMFLGIGCLILKKKYDIYHAHNFHTLPLSVISARLRKKKVIYDTHESWTIHREKKFDLEHIISFIFEKTFLPYIDGFITVNELVNKYYQEKFGIKNGIVLYNTPRIVRLKKNKYFHRELKLDSKKVIVLFQGGFWGKNRGIFELINASKHIRDEAIIVLLGFGTPDLISKIKSKIIDSKLEKKVFIFPPKSPERLLDYTMSADIGMNLINREGRAQDFQSPWKLFEYCMAGLAVISTDLAFHRKVHKKYKIGPLIKTNNNPKDIAKTVNKLIEEPLKLAKYKENARKAAEVEFNWENQEKKLLSLYKNLGV